ncbi:RDD family protein [soil metagenome]|nr:RDD family protein [Trueperaceae bacterium]
MTSMIPESNGADESRVQSTSQAAAPSVPLTSTDDAAKAPDTLTRFLAFLIDGIAVGLVGLVPVIGGIAGIAYVLFRDGLDVEYMRRRSLGKTLMKLTVVRDDGAPMDLMTSARRNWPLAFGSLTQLLVFIPILGWALIPLVLIAGVVFVIIEIVKVTTDPDGRRWGDGLAKTRVVVSAD